MLVCLRRTSAPQRTWFRRVGRTVDAYTNAACDGGSYSAEDTTHA
jgi:hypothetical protein